MNIVDKVESLRYNTHTNIRNIQEAKIPVLYNLKLERRYSFKTHGFYHSAYDDTWLLYVCRNLPFNVNQERHVYVDKLENMVKRNEIRPFLLFIDNKFVKWSNIEIINDCKFSYILIKNNKNLINPKCECILLPHNNIVYKENVTSNSENSRYIFNENGLMVQEALGDKYTTIDIIDKDLYSNDLVLKEGTKQQSTIDYTKYKISNSNFITFRNGFLESDAKLEIHGLNIFSVNNNKLYGNSYIVKESYYLKSNECLDNILLPVNKGNIINNIKNNTIAEYVLELAKSFDFTFDRFISYEENIKKSLIYIMAYNSNLMNEIYKESSNMISKLYKGSDIIKRKDKNGYVTMSRRNYNNVDCYPIIFHNGNLYNSYNETVFKNKDFKFPVVNISEQDDIEILFFKKVDNRVYPLYFPSLETKLRILDSSIDTNYTKLFTINPENITFNLERKDITQYEVPFEIKRDGNFVELELKDSFYYDRKLSMVSSRQFRYMSNIIQEETVNITLSEDFRFCNNKEQYIVFINGRKIDSNHYKITIAKSTRPFDDISIYLNIPLQKNHKIEVFYLPDILEELSFIPRISTNGIISINKDKLSYGLDNELYMIFVNGRKINHNQMVNMDSNRLKIITDLKSIRNVSIIKHVKDNDILLKFFKSIDSTIDKVYKDLPAFELSYIYNTDNTYTDVEADINKDIINMDKVLYKIIQDYYMRPYINDGDVFEYDFDEFEGELEKDSDGNTLFSLMDATKEDKLST